MQGCGKARDRLAISNSIDSGGHYNGANDVIFDGECIFLNESRDDRGQFDCG